MSYKTQNNLLNQLKTIEREKKYVESKIERLDQTKQQGNEKSNQYSGKRDRDNFDRQSHQQKYNKKPSNDSSMFQRRTVKLPTSTNNNVNSSSNNENNSSSSNNNNNEKAIENKQRGRMFVGLLNRTLMDFKKETSTKTEADIKREVIESKIESVISKEEEERNEREKIKKQQIKEKEIKYHEDLVKKQELLEEKILIEGWNLHERTLSKFKYKTVSKPHIYFQLNYLAEKHNFQLPAYLPKSNIPTASTTIETTSTTTKTNRNRNDSDSENDEIIDKEVLKNEEFLEKDSTSKIQDHLNEIQDENIKKADNQKTEENDSSQINDNNSMKDEEKDDI